MKTKTFLLTMTIALICFQTKSKISIISPVDSKKTLKYSVSTFGFVDYQATIEMEVILWDSKEGCELPSSSLKRRQSDYPKAYLVQRGGCTFLKKSSNAREAGARIVFVSMDGNQDVTKLISTEQNPLEKKTQTLPPVVLISKSDGEYMRNLIEKDKKEVRVRVDFDISIYKPPVPVKYIYSVSDLNSIDILAELVAFEIGFIFKGSTEKDIEFTTRKIKHLMELETVPKLSELANNNVLTPSQKKDLCFPGSTFCLNIGQRVAKMDNQYEQIIAMTAFQCANQQVLKKGRDLLTIFWYRQFLMSYKECFLNEQKKKESSFINIVGCTFNSMAKDTTFKDKVSQCVGDKVVFQSEKKILDKAFYKRIVKISTQSLDRWPALYIHDNLVRGDLSPYSAVSAFCDVLRPSHKPDRCQAATEILMDRAQELDDVHPMSIIMTVFMLFLIGIILFGLGAIVSRKAFSKKIEKDINNEIENTLKKYYELNDTKIQINTKDDSELEPDNL